MVNRPNNSKFKDFKKILTTLGKNVFNYAKAT
jgi:hypothetical protein